MKWIRLFLLLAAAAVCAASCRRSETASAEKAKRYTLKGVIREVNTERSEVTVEHETIADYMQGMTMAFPVRDDPQVTKLLRPGDKIEATLVVEKDRYWLEKILTRGFVGTPAPPPPSTVSPGRQAAGTGFVTPVPNRGVQLGDPVPDFVLTDQAGLPVRLSQMRGEPVAVTFLYTRCPIATACPMTTAKFSKLDAMLAKEKFGHLLTVTVDPEHDTPAVLAEYAKMVGADLKRWKFLTGAPAAVADVATSFGVMYYPEKGQMIHTQAVAVVDPKGNLATIYYGEHWEAEHILRDMQKARNG
ncbi:MAG TPA: SCO family protein [Thermoanaerobaculia bacterium]|nr:SCO family protein [Thermoanaerobaculia bacterium]